MECRLIGLRFQFGLNGGQIVIIIFIFKADVFTFGGGGGVVRGPVVQSQFVGR